MLNQWNSHKYRVEPIHTMWQIVEKIQAPDTHVSPGDWDSKVSSSPWVLKSEMITMSIAGSSLKPAKKDAIGLATSADGVSFHKTLQ